ncbi:toll/interleukin-1 receptor domain-containing protein [Bradyrhizobium sp. SZCCHNS3004]|uniref:toll/interleukin-1 receptor domain-containing protein n=1 Tax=Bradyrhizobium sp. SZCCHNS3004 TaxID=3057312 RepID=UPI002916D42C|nr:toll/interleukin-1 receptor domain-containing protein [Bradyrhizobium sp. SZCCHNS3004]
MSLYELAILGRDDPDICARLNQTITSMVADFELAVGTDVIIHDRTSIAARDKKAAFACAYIGGDATMDVEIAKSVIKDSAPVIPSVGPDENFATAVPAVLSFANGLRRRADDPDMKELAAALLECVGLLRKQRRVFISYRRTESRMAALQLHDVLASRGFDVFLDTHDIRPGEPFQDVLWHRLCDSDVVLMLDTPTYFASTWTQQELGRARAKEIHVLRIVWPGHTPNRRGDFAETIYLDAGELVGVDGPIVGWKADTIVLNVERLRSKSIASRYRTITGKLRVEVELIGGNIVGIGSHRAVSIKLDDDQSCWAYPIVGIPTAELLHDVALKAARAEQNGVPILVYDGVGISKPWEDHLNWLDSQITAVRALRSDRIAWELAEGVV